MSVKFEKETIRDAPVPGGRRHDIVHEVGERLTGGDTTKGYLAVCVREMIENWACHAKILDIRHISSSYRRTLSAQRCLLQDLLLHCKKFWHLGWLMILVGWSVLEFPRWRHMEPSSAHPSVTS